MQKILSVQFHSRMKLPVKGTFHMLSFNQKSINQQMSYQQKLINWSTSSAVPPTVCFWSHFPWESRVDTKRQKSLSKQMLVLQWKHAAALTSSQDVYCFCLFYSEWKGHRGLMLWIPKIRRGVSSHHFGAAAWQDCLNERQPCQRSA